MHYYIDGYNLLFRLLGGADEQLKSQREKLIQKLYSQIELLELDVTLVFDSQYQFGEGSRSHFGNLEILYTPEGVTADDFIIQALKISDRPRQETVVTSDKHLAWCARRQSAHTESVEIFFGWLTKRCKNKNKIRKEVILAPAPKPSIPLEKKSIAPQNLTLENSLDYYQKLFEENYLKIQSSEAADVKLTNKVTDKPSKKSKKPKIQKEENPISDMERWLKIFESKDKEY